MSSDGRGPASVPFDPRPLVEPVDRAAVRAYAQQLRAQRGANGFGAGSIIQFAIVLIMLLVFASVFLPLLGSGIGRALSGGTSFFSSTVAVVPLLIIGTLLAIVVVATVRGWTGGRERRYRLDQFAHRNGMSYLPELANPALPGMIFGHGGSRTASDLVRGERPRFVEFANYRYTTGSGKNRTTHRWGYVAVRLDVPLPHIVLDAQGNNGLFGSNLPSSFDKDQRLSLEGDFDRHFALYCPEGYEADALYLFTPDIMARFIDNAAALDVEIVDDWLFLYAKRDFSTLDPATWAWLFSVVGALLDKFAQWSRWRDDRLAASVPLLATPAAVPESSSDAMTDAAPLPFTEAPTMLRPPPGVARAGKRLTRRTPWLTWIVAGLFVVVWFVMQSGLLERLFGFWR